MGDRLGSPSGAASFLVGVVSVGVFSLCSGIADKVAVLRGWGTVAILAQGTTSWLATRSPFDGAPSGQLLIRLRFWKDEVP